MATTTLGIPTIASTDLVQNGPAQIDAALNAIDALFPHVVTSLPGSPVDTQLFWFLADSSDDVQWDFRYRAGSSSGYKWTFRGGAAVIRQDVAARSGASLLANTVQPIVTSNNFTLPFAGDYDVSISGSVLVTSATSGNVVSAVTSVAAPTVSLGAGSSTRSVTASGTQAVAIDSGPIRIRGVAAGTQITPAIGFNVASVSWTTQSAVLMTVTPVRVG